eukprot:scaffold492_cov341-Pavlova_lutheri.AAC.17
MASAVSSSPATTHPTMALLPASTSKARVSAVALAVLDTSTGRVRLVACTFHVLSLPCVPFALFPPVPTWIVLVHACFIVVLRPRRSVSAPLDFPFPSSPSGGGKDALHPTFLSPSLSPPLPLCLSLCLPPCPCLPLPLCLPVPLPVSLPACPPPSVSPSLSPSLPACPPPSVSPSLSPSLSPCVSLCVPPCPCVSVGLSVSEGDTWHVGVGQEGKPCSHTAPSPIRGEDGMVEGDPWESTHT